jgi:3-deoxy-D-manno-octulosonic acid kinase
VINSRRIATSTGAMLSDPACLGNPPADAAESLFDPEFWRSRNELVSVTRGRGSAWFVADGVRQWVLRHYRRGGWIAHIAHDRYLWTGEARVRAFAEWRLLESLSQRGLPVPRPVAARYQRSGLLYRCDLITQRIVDAEPLSEMLGQGAICESTWRALGTAVARLHRAGVDHADLNAHNLLLDTRGAVTVIDFDRGRIRAPGTWSTRNLARLRRSLAKLSRELPADRYSERNWQWFVAGYGVQFGLESP